MRVRRFRARAPAVERMNDKEVESQGQARGTEGRNSIEGPKRERGRERREVRCSSPALPSFHPNVREHVKAFKAPLRVHMRCPLAFPLWMRERNELDGANVVSASSRLPPPSSASYTSSTSPSPTRRIGMIAELTCSSYVLLPLPYEFCPRESCSVGS